MKKLLTIKVTVILCMLFLGSCSQEPSILYDQNTKEPLTGIVEIFGENGQLVRRANYVDGKKDGLEEWFDENGKLFSADTFKNGEIIEWKLDERAE
tara:strand:+ start:731 stop:1018 length:288 start_codon:yes stop_codon:yes gene_type:complete